jgi:hypothetical protein
MLPEAVVDELIDSNPCVLKRGELPGKIDKDPTGRSRYEWFSRRNPSSASIPLWPSKEGSRQRSPDV